MCSDLRRCAADKVYQRAQNLLAGYKEMGLPLDKTIIRIPATWEGIQAAKKLEAEGIATHIILVYRYHNMLAHVRSSLQKRAQSHIPIPACQCTPPRRHIPACMHCVHVVVAL